MYSDFFFLFESSILSLDGLFSDFFNSCVRYMIYSGLDSSSFLGLFVIERGLLYASYRIEKQLHSSFIICFCVMVHDIGLCFCYV